MHICVSPPAAPPRRPGVIGHELTDPLAYQVLHEGLRFVDPATLFCQLSSVLHLRDLVAVGDALVLTPVYDDGSGDRPWVPLPLLSKRVEQFRGRGKRTAARALSLVRDGSESRPETHVRLALVGAGLPEPELNVAVYTADGRFLGRGDMVYQRWRVLVEYDGDHHRTSTEQYDGDLQRIDGFIEDGWRVIRIVGRAFYGNRAGEVARVARALSDAGWKPGSPRAGAAPCRSSPACRSSPRAGVAPREPTPGRAPLSRRCRSPRGTPFGS